MYIFGFITFKNIGLLNSTIIVGILLVFYFVFNIRYRKIVLNILRKKRVLIIFLALISIIMVCIINPTVQQTYEYSIVQTYVNQFINLFIGVLVYCLFVYKNKQDKLVNYIIYIFLIQAGIQLISFVFPPINEFLNFFRSDKAIEIGQQQYGGIRALSISAQSFFGLGVGYGLIYLLFLMNWKRIPISNILIKYLAFFLLVFGGASAARSSYAGIVLGVLYIIIQWLFISKTKGNSKGIKQFNKKKVIRTIVSVPVIIIMLSLIYIQFSNNDSLDQKIDKMNNFAFQMFYNYQESGQLETSSTDALFNRMYFSIESTKTVLIGDAIYSNDDGSYYMHTDAGYMRNVLYFGIIGLIILLIYQMKFFEWRDRSNWIPNIFILTYILVMHIKGDVLGFSIMLQNILFIIYLSELDRLRNKETGEIPEFKAGR